ncbi:hypothetical protein LOZ53_006267 [Ophidiomyces ophidiicola]|nr:hypothetical protein LOZ55_006115 [Ophidiomyces ophidiicola]KAI1982554.1 hypothetical protein LOZ53_006267 [Ophidiomyces ophidiicola]KAI1985974.1 hypothetical protein LOZ54_004045 [Ophidiomyces ophidiicola]
MTTTGIPLDPTSPKSPEPEIHSIQCSLQSSDRLPTATFNSQPPSINEEYSREITPLSKENLEQLGELPATPGSSLTLIPNRENTGESADANQHHGSIQTQQILSRASFAGLDISPIIEQPHSADTLIAQVESENQEDMSKRRKIESESLRLPSSKPPSMMYIRTQSPTIIPSKP